MLLSVIVAHDFFDAMAAEAAVKTQLVARLSTVLSGRTARGVTAGAGAAATRTRLVLSKRRRQTFAPTIMKSNSNWNGLE